MRIIRIKITHTNDKKIRDALQVRRVGAENEKPAVHLFCENSARKSAKSQSFGPRF